MVQEKRPALTQCKAWAELKARADAFAGIDLRTLFEQQPSRVEALTLEAGKLWVDFSKHRLDPGVLETLLALASERRVSAAIEALFAGEPVNTTERLPAGHWRLRAEPEEAGQEVLQQLSCMGQMVHKVHSRQWRGLFGDPITDVVNLGVGGSDLGPLMVATALDEHCPAEGQRPEVHFVSSMDGSQLSRLLNRLDPGRTLFIVASKSFRTRDTLANADAALAWLRAELETDGEELLGCHFIGVSANPDAMTEWGIPQSNQLRLWDWVGGRVSLWSAIGLAVAMRIGMPAFRELLDGARRMDDHFRREPLAGNLPVIAALIDIWNINFLDIRARAVLPYDARLKFLPSYQEQLEMESNGKSVNVDGESVDYHTCPVIWGEVGTNAQHAFYQLLHQGTQSVVCEFVMTGLPHGFSDVKSSTVSQHRLSQANCLAQSHLLAFGSEDDEVDPHRLYRGNQPSTTLHLSDFGPQALGSFLAFLEHRVYVQAAIWGVNPFDQWGVERGKVMAKQFEQLLESNPDNLELLFLPDYSTQNILRRLARTEKE